MVCNGKTLKRYPCIVVSYDHNTFDWHEVIPNSVGQFSGKTISTDHPVFDDKIKLWEDDIFTIGDSNVKYKVAFENFEWIGISNEGDHWGLFERRLSSIDKAIHIQGNIHDNPELFK